MQSQVFVLYCRLPEEWGFCGSSTTGQMDTLSVQEWNDFTLLRGASNLQGYVRAAPRPDRISSHYYVTVKLVPINTH